MSTLLLNYQKKIANYLTYQNKTSEMSSIHNQQLFISQTNTRILLQKVKCNFYSNCYTQEKSLLFFSIFSILFATSYLSGFFLPFVILFLYFSGLLFMLFLYTCYSFFKLHYHLIYHLSDYQEYNLIVDDIKTLRTIKNCKRNEIKIL